MNERILEERKRLGFNQTDFARLGGVQISAQVNYEKGVRVPNADYLSAIAKAGADVLYILQGHRSARFLNSEERFLLEKFRLSTPSTQAAIWQLLLSNPDAVLEQVQIKVKQNNGQIATQIVNN